MLTETETNETELAMQQLEEVLDGGDKDRIHEKIEALNEISRPYAERLMDTAVAAALRDKKI
jgi:molecular chaperone HscA